MHISSHIAKWSMHPSPQGQPDCHHCRARGLYRKKWQGYTENNNRAYRFKVMYLQPSQFDRLFTVHVFGETACRTEKKIGTTLSGTCCVPPNCFFCPAFFSPFLKEKINKPLLRFIINKHRWTRDSHWVLRSYIRSWVNTSTHRFLNQETLLLLVTHVDENPS